MVVLLDRTGPKFWVTFAMSQHPEMAAQAQRQRLVRADITPVVAGEDRQSCQELLGFLRDMHDSSTIAHATGQTVSIQTSGSIKCRTKQRPL